MSGALKTIPMISSPVQPPSMKLSTNARGGKSRATSRLQRGASQCLPSLSTQIAFSIYTTQHDTAFKRVFRYLAGTKTLCILYEKGHQGVPRGYSDADWAGPHSEAALSTSGSQDTYFTWLAVPSHGLRNSRLVSHSLQLGTESEYVAASLTAQEAVWLLRLLQELDQSIPQPMDIHVDNTGAMALAVNPAFCSRTKHMAIRYHIMRDFIKNGKILLRQTPSEDMLADGLAKPLAKPWRPNSSMQ